MASRSVSMGPGCLTHAKLTSLSPPEFVEYFRLKGIQHGKKWSERKLRLYKIIAYRYKRFYCDCCTCGRNCKPCFTQQRKQEMINILIIAIFLESGDQTRRRQYMREAAELANTTLPWKCNGSTNHAPHGQHF